MKRTLLISVNEFKEKATLDFIKTQVTGTYSIFCSDGRAAQISEKIQKALPKVSEFSTSSDFCLGSSQEKMCEIISNSQVETIIIVLSGKCHKDLPRKLLQCDPGSRRISTSRADVACVIFNEFQPRVEKTEIEEVEVLAV